MNFSRHTHAINTNCFYNIIITLIIVLTVLILVLMHVQTLEIMYTPKFLIFRSVMPTEIFDYLFAVLTQYYTYSYTIYNATRAHTCYFVQAVGRHYSRNNEEA